MSRFCFFELREGRMFGGGGLEEHGMRRASKWCWFVEPRRWRKNVHTLLQGCFLFLETPKSIYHPSTTPVPQAPKNPSSGFWTHFEFLLLSFFWGGGGGGGLSVRALIRLTSAIACY